MNTRIAVRFTFFILVALSTCGQTFPSNEYHGGEGLVRHYPLSTAGSTCTSNTGNTVAVSSAAPPQLLTYATTTQPFITDQTANTCKVGLYGVYGAAAISSLCQRGSFTTWAAGSPTGWTEANTAGAGAADWTEETTHVAHGTSSAKAELTAADSATTLTGACMTVTGNTAYYVDGWAKELSGTGLFDINILEDDSADCGSITDTTAVIDDAGPTSTWAHYGGTITTQAGTIRAQVQISLPAAAAQSLVFDAMQFRAGSLPTDAHCSTDADATAVCSAYVPSIDSPISANGTMQIEGVWRSPWAGTGLAASAYLVANGTPGNANSFFVRVNNARDEPTYSTYDSGATLKTIKPDVANWAANTDYTVKASKTAAGAMRLWWNSVWNTTEAGAGTGINDAAQTTTYLCSSNTTPSDCWVKSLKFFRRLRGN